MKKKFKYVFLFFLIASLAFVFSNSASAEEFRFKSPSGPTLTLVNDVAIDSSGNIYAVVEHNVIKFNPSGTVLLEIGSFGTGNGDFDSPLGIALDSSGNIYVTDTSNHRVQIFNSAGVYQSQFGTQGSGEGQFDFPEGIAVNGTHIFIGDTQNHRVQIFNSAGVFQFMFGWGVDTGAAAFETCTSGCQAGLSGSGDGQFSFLGGVEVDSSGNIYVTDSFNDRVQIFNSAGAFQSKFGSFGTGEDQFNLPNGITVDSSGDIYVVDTGNDRVQIFNSAGVFQFMFGWGVDTGAAAFETCTSGCQAGISGSGDGQFVLPDGITVDSSGNIYVTDSFNDRVQIFNSAGAFQSKFGSKGSGDGQFNSLRGITVDSSGNIYVLGNLNHRIQKFVNAACIVPGSGDMTITDDCIFSGNAAAPANVIVQADKLMIISNGATLDIDFVNNFLRIEFPGGILIKAGGAIN